MGKLKLLKGFSLLEVILAMAVLSIGLLAIVGLITSGLRGFKGATQKLQDIALAQQEIEGIRDIRDSGGDISIFTAGSNPYIITSTNGLITTHLYDWQ